MVPLKLIYFEGYLSKNDAYRRERYLKSGMGKRDLKNRLRGGLTGWKEMRGYISKIS